MKGEKDTSNLPIGKDTGIPECYVLPESQRPKECSSEIIDIPIISLAGLHKSPLERDIVVGDIRRACQEMGFFHIIDHGICQSVLDDGMSAATDFFNLPTEDKRDLMSNDIYKPVRYGSSIKDGLDKVQFWRVFLKHYAHPLKKWIHLWPSNPPQYKENMGKFSLELRKLALEAMEAITESLGLPPSYLNEKMEDGMQVMTVNCYPPCPHPELSLGLPPHSDYSCITILLQNCIGLQIKPLKDGGWINVPVVKGALQVLIGDHFEVLSNGLYKSVLHRAILNSKKTRISIASFHNLGMDTKMETEKKLVDEQHPKGYKESSFRDFLDFLSVTDITDGKRFIDMLKITE